MPLSHLKENSTQLHMHKPGLHTVLFSAAYVICSDIWHLFMYPLHMAPAKQTVPGPH